MYYPVAQGNELTIFRSIFMPMTLPVRAPFSDAKQEKGCSGIPE